MNYAAYGLDTVKKEKDEDAKVKAWQCMWCNEDKKEHAFSLCFSAFVICSACINAALHFADEQHRWHEAVDCFKCRKQPVTGYRNHTNYAVAIYLCEPCLQLGSKLIDGFEEQKRLKQTQFTNMVEDILKRCTVDGNIVKLPDEKLDRDVYMQVKKKLEGIGGKWKGGKTNGFVFDEDPAMLLAALADGEAINLKKQYQFFPTPPDIARQMASYLPAALQDGYRILEPSAGRGALIQAVRDHFGFDCMVDCYEAMPVNRIKLAAMPEVNVLGDDFLQCEAKNTYSIILANPPFTNNQDIDHIYKMYEVLAPGGMLITLASPSWTSGTQRKQVEFKTWLELLEVFPLTLPDKAFASSGTNIKPVLLQFKKPVANGVENFTQLETASYQLPFAEDVPTCRVCGCTDEDCSQCIAATGEPCHWVEIDLCSRCERDQKLKSVHVNPDELNAEFKRNHLTEEKANELTHAIVEHFKEVANNKRESVSHYPHAEALQELTFSQVMAEELVTGEAAVEAPQAEITAPLPVITEATINQPPVAEETAVLSHDDAIEAYLNEQPVETAGEDINDEPSPVTTNFFSELKTAMHQLSPDVTLRIQYTGEQMRVVVIPNNGIPADGAPLVLAGTEEDMNTEFFSYVSGAVLKASRSVTDVQAYNQKIADARKEIENIQPPEKNQVAAPIVPAKQMAAKKTKPNEKKAIPSLFV